MSPSCFPLFFPPVDSLLARLVACASLVAQLVKNLPAVWETWVQSLGQEDPLEKRMATRSSILAGGSDGQRSLAAYSPWELQRAGHD